MNPISHANVTVDEPCIVFLGRLVYEKGVQVLLDAMPEVIQRHRKAKLAIVGAGPLLEDLQRHVNSQRISQYVTFTGFASDEVRNQLFATAHLVVVPSLYEPFGIVALEAMAAKTPVVVSDIGGLGDLVEHGVSRRRAYPADVASLALQICEALDDESLSRTMAQVAFARLVNYDWSKISCDLIQLYSENCVVPS